MRNTIRMIKELGLEIVVEGVGKPGICRLSDRTALWIICRIFLFQADSDRDFLELLRRKMHNIMRKGFQKMNYLI